MYLVLSLQQSFRFHVKYPQYKSLKFINSFRKLMHGGKTKCPSNQK